MWIGWLAERGGRVRGVREEGDKGSFGIFCGCATLFTAILELALRLLRRHIALRRLVGANQAMNWSIVSVSFM